MPLPFLAVPFPQQGGPGGQRRELVPATPLKANGIPPPRVGRRRTLTPFFNKTWGAEKIKSGGVFLPYRPAGAAKVTGAARLRFAVAAPSRTPRQHTATAKRKRTGTPVAQFGSGGRIGSSAAELLMSRLRGLLTGRRSTNLLPLPTWLCTTMSPPCSRRILRLTARPSPVPLDPLVLTNGLKMSVIFWAGMPVPLSSTSSRTQP